MRASDHPLCGRLHRPQQFRACDGRERARTGPGSPAALGRQHCLGAGTLSPRNEALAAVRPERIELASEPFESTHVRCEDKPVYFVGPYTEYFLDLAGHTIRAQSSTLINAGLVEPSTGRKFEYCQILAQPAGKAMEAAAA